MPPCGDRARALTSDETVANAHTLCAAIGKETIEVAQDIPGFVVNRLQTALLREALHLVEFGVASIADIDHAVETTLARAGPPRARSASWTSTLWRRSRPFSCRP